MHYLLETPRLLLREFVPADAQDMFDLNSDPDVVRYTGDRAFHDLAEAEALLRNYDVYTREGYGRWLVVLRETGETLGWCGLRYQQDLGMPDIGYRFFQRHWNKGYATESARASLDYGFGPLNISRIMGRAMMANHASIRVFKKLGMQFWKDDILEGQPSVCYRIERGAFRDQASSSLNAGQTTG